MGASHEQTEAVPAAGRPLPGGTLLSPGERLPFLMVLGLILVWGFSGSWELPEPTRVPAMAVFESARQPAQDSSRSATVLSPLAIRGEALFEENGCAACHSITGERKIGPSLLGIYGTQQPLDDGSVVLVDQAYIHQSILEPGTMIVEGYEDSMPSYQELVTDEDLDALSAFIRSLEP